MISRKERKAILLNMKIKNMKINERDIELMAHIAGIELSDEEKMEFTEDLNAILDYTEVLQKVDTEGEEPAAFTEILKVIRVTNK